MRLTSTAEDYLKSIYYLQARGAPITTSELARLREVSASSASQMLARMEDSGWITRKGGRPLQLTAAGEAIALAVTRRHRLAELFLHDVLGFDLHEVHHHADILEHVIAGPIEERIDAYLGHPERDPHGDPIPRADLRDHDEGWPRSLADAAEGTRFEVERLLDRDAEALQYLESLGIKPGAMIDVGEQLPFDGPLWIEIGASRHALGRPLVRIIHGKEVSA